jgi:bacillithiol biosynthesis cysteine-adding enzyme BshC
MSDLAADYLASSDALAPFFAHPPRLDGLAMPPARPADAALVAAVNAAQERLGSSGRLAADDLVIVTGQQPGLFTGPLYTIYKAITALRLAEGVTARTGRACTPVFWVAADDHDFEEVRTAHFLSKQHAVLPLTYTPEADVSGMPMGRVPLESGLHALIDTLAAQTSGSEFRDEIAAFLHASCDASGNLAEWFARILARLFQGTPLVVFPSDLPAARAVAAPVLARALEAPLVPTETANAAGARLAALGYDPQVIKGQSECAFFLEVDGRRRKVLWQEGSFHLPETGQRLDAAAMRDRLAGSPEVFSANVLLRGVVQQTLFPGTVAYVGGPGEIAYWAQLRGVFGHFDTPMPAVLPRARAVLTTAKLNKLLARQGLSLADLDAPLERLLDRALAASGENPLAAALGEHGARLSAEAAAMVSALTAAQQADAGARAVAAAFAAQVDDGVARVLRAVRRADTARVDTARPQIQRLSHALFPGRKPQERVLCVFSYLFEQGWDLIPRLTRALDPARTDLQEIAL